MHQSSVLVLLVVLASIYVVSAGHVKKVKMSKKMEFMKNCTKSGTDTKWKAIHEECRSEIMMMSNTTSATAQDKKKGKNKMAHKCVHACHLKKQLFPDNTMKADAIQTFSKNLNDAMQEVFVMQVNSCFTSKSVDLNKLSMSTNTTENCETWEAPVKCFKKALKMACSGNSTSTELLANGKSRVMDSDDVEDLMEDDMESTTMRN